MCQQSHTNVHLVVHTPVFLPAPTYPHVSRDQLCMAMPEHIYIDKCHSLAQWRCNNYDTGLMQQKLSSITSWSLLCNDFGQIVHMSSDTEYLLVAKGQWCSVKVTTGLVSEWPCITRLSGIPAWSSMAYDSQISTLSMLCNITPFTFIQLLQCLFISVSQVCSGMACITNESLLYLDNANTWQTEKKNIMVPSMIRRPQNAA